MARTITVDTGEELKTFIDNSVQSGNYKTTSEGLRLLQGNMWDIHNIK